MRTLKFRYWNTITKEMVNNPKMPYKENWTIEQLFEDRGWVWMQFTGLTDRHGVEIYEGDIVIFKNNRGYYLKKEVTWNVGVRWQGFRLGTGNRELKVIGNIYEHGHLLENESKE